MRTEKISLPCAFKEINEDVPTPVAVSLEGEGPGSRVLRVEFELPGRPMWFASYFDMPQLLRFAGELEQMHDGKRTGASLWDSDRMLHLYLQSVPQISDAVMLGGFSYDYILAETGCVPIEDPEEELPDLLTGELRGLLVAFQGLVAPLSSLPELASLIRVSVEP